MVPLLDNLFNLRIGACHCQKMMPIFCCEPIVSSLSSEPLAQNRRSIRWVFPSSFVWSRFFESLPMIIWIKANITSLLPVLSELPKGNQYVWLPRQSSIHHTNSKELVVLAHSSMAEKGNIRQYRNSFTIHGWKITINYRGELKGLFVLLSRSRTGPGRAVKQEQDENSCNHAQAV